MAALDHQLGFANESVYGTAAVATRFFEYESEAISEEYGRTEGDPLRTGSPVIRSDRFTPYFVGASGTVSMAVLTKGFGYFLQHMLGAVATTGPAEISAYTHTGTVGELFGKSFTAQVNRPFHPSGTNQPFTYEGGKVSSWTLANAVDGNLMLDLECDFEQVSTATALATASYPTAMEPLTWAGGVVEIGGVAYDVDEIEIGWNNGLATDRHKIRGNTNKKEPTSARREGTFSISADFDSLTQRNRAYADTRAGALAALTAKWTAPTLLGTTIKPSLTVTIPAVRFDEWSGATGGTEAITQSLSGVIRYDGTNSPITVAYVSADTTP